MNLRLGFELDRDFEEIDPTLMRFEYGCIGFKAVAREGNYNAIVLKACDCEQEGFDVVQRCLRDTASAVPLSTDGMITLLSELSTESCEAAAGRALDWAMQLLGNSRESTQFRPPREEKAEEDGQALDLRKMTEAAAGQAPDLREMTSVDSRSANGMINLLS